LRQAWLHAQNSNLSIGHVHRSLLGGGLRVRQDGRFERRVGRVKSVEDSKIGSGPRPDFTKLADFGEWAADYLDEWGGREGRPPGVRVLVRLRQVVAGIAS